VSGRLALGDLISRLVAEHKIMKDDLLRVRKATESKDFEAASKALEELDRTFRRHIADEEGQVLRFLIEVYGVKGAEDEIRVFQQHRPMHATLEAIKKLATLTPDELATHEDSLWTLFAEHTFAEENSVFPRAMRASKKDSPS
jgi:hemerythrin-like domain-containing protein